MLPQTAGRVVALGHFESKHQSTSVFWRSSRLDVSSAHCCMPNPRLFGKAEVASLSLGKILQGLVTVVFAIEDAVDTFSGSSQS